MDDHYTTLGIRRGASIDRIKAAYRKAAKDFHPDIGSCSDGDEEFLRTQEAYEVLSDAERRKAYDRDLDRRDTAVPVTRRHGTDVRRSYERLDPFTSLLDRIFGGLEHGFYDTDLRRGKELFLEIELSPAEAAAGGFFPLSVPLIETCRECRGTGYAGFSYCPACHGEGRVAADRRFSVSVPAGVYDGLEARVPLEGIGLSERFVDVVIRVRGSRYR
jgi:molecular chaperone DnaJ